MPRVGNTSSSKDGRKAFEVRRRRRFTSVVLAEDQRQGEQGLGEEKALSGSRTQRAVVSDVMEACGQDMLKDSGKEIDRIENERFGFAGLRRESSSTGSK